MKSLGFRIALGTSNMFFDTASYFAKQVVDLNNTVTLTRKSIPILREIHQYNLAAYDLKSRARNQLFYNQLQKELEIVKQNYLAIAGEHNPELFDKTLISDLQNLIIDAIRPSIMSKEFEDLVRT